MGQEDQFTVVVRVRPLTKAEKLREREIIQVLDGKVIIVSEPTTIEGDYLRVNRSR